MFVYRNDNIIDNLIHKGMSIVIYVYDLIILLGFGGIIIDNEMIINNPNNTIILNIFFDIFSSFYIF